MDKSEFTSRILAPFLGRRRTQPYWERLHRLAIAGMNLGSGADDPRRSGEAMVLRSLSPGATVLDVGANVGMYSALALELVPEIHLLAFEPQPAAAVAWRAAIGARARLLEIGLGEADASVQLFGSEVDSGLASTTRRVHPGLTWEPVAMIRVRSLDDVAAEEGIAHVDLLKVDVEGGEVDVLRGARRMLAEGRIDRVQFEFGGSAIDSRIYLRDLVDALAGYRLHRIVRDGWVPVAYSELDEIFTTGNYLALR
jgi:FkbM family methyltransferase